MPHTTLNQFLPAIQTLNTGKSLTKQELLTASFRIEKDGDLSMYYAPHNESINPDAKIVIVGITPGWQQMKTAFEQFITSLSSDKTLETCLKETKKAAGFAGSMRKNLTAMLDQCGVPHILGMTHSADLFEHRRDLLHTTSVVKYPVFINGKNYTGHQPPIDRAPLLQPYAYNMFPDEMAQITSNALVIPLGRTVDSVIVRLAEEDKLPRHTFLTGFPHPSGANGHRVKQFQQQKRQLQEKVTSWAGEMN
ncbi:hypothetical protein [Lentibacillus salinarum]|uniref:Uracil-DNA glycosylase-like domain-containing protein n=1 Tax=Lentibacillus salinarum TaxID=446820 RepID=A0ABW3ZXY7_9BACI